jgi:hypothetical protein
METLQEKQEMTMDMDRAIQVLDELLFNFVLRSGGGPDCVLISQAEEAIRFLRSLQKNLQGQEK